MREEQKKPKLEESISMFFVFGKFKFKSKLKSRLSIRKLFVHLQKTPKKKQKKKPKYTK